jgi:hypothetical protein
MLARAEALLEDGDVEGAVAGLDRLPDAARDVLGPVARRRQDGAPRSTATSPPSAPSPGGLSPAGQMSRTLIRRLPSSWWRRWPSRPGLTGEPGHASAHLDGLARRHDSRRRGLDDPDSGRLAVHHCSALAHADLWIVEAPRRAERARAEAGAGRPSEALSRGFLACAAGDGSEARRLAQKAADLAEEAPGLVRVLAAQAAEAAGDAVAAKAAYSAMLGFPEMRLAGHARPDAGRWPRATSAGALRHAETAYGLGRTARWAWRALLEARLEVGDWAGGAGARPRRAGPQDRLAGRRRAQPRGPAGRLGRPAGDAPEPKARAQALDHAVRSPRSCSRASRRAWSWPPACWPTTARLAKRRPADRGRLEGRSRTRRCGWPIAT